LKVTIDIEIRCVNENWDTLEGEDIEHTKQRLNKRLPHNKKIKEILLIEKTFIGLGYCVYYK